MVRTQHDGQRGRAGLSPAILEQPGVRLPVGAATSLIHPVNLTPVLTVSDQADDALRAVIADNFDAHALAAGVPSNFQLLAIRVERGGVLLGGLMGRTGRGWLTIEYLALPMAEQGQGIGRQLMTAAEAEAVHRGCHSAFLSTIAFQAPGFYQKLGYREFARLEDDDPVLSRIWLRKRLT